MEGYTCLVERDGNTVFSDKRSGIVPVVELLERGLDVKGCKAYDKIVGKAAALLYALSGVASVFAEVMSEGGKDVLERYGIAWHAETITPAIINRRGDGLCPMEKTVADIDDPHAAFAAIKSKLTDMKNESGNSNKI